VTPAKLRIACFVSSHGFGHATRISAVISQLSQKTKSLEVYIFSQTPSWFWYLNLPHNCIVRVIEEVTDIGLVQQGPFHHSLINTHSRISQWLPFSESRLKKPLSLLVKQDPHLILSDISPLGIELGNRLQIPSILIENFTWDWIYQSYLNQYREFEQVINRLKKIYLKADLRIQCLPFCEKKDNCPSIKPIFRPPKIGRDVVYSKLGLNSNDKYLILTTGGIPMEHQVLECYKDFYIIIPGNYSSIKRTNRLIYLPMNCELPFIDLVKSSQLVIGKAGYGTVSECWGMNIPFLGVFRDKFPESKVLRKFCQENLCFNEISHSSFISGSWLENWKELKPIQKMNQPKLNGAIQAADLILNFICKQVGRI
jgi:hypothetical protein